MKVSVCYFSLYFRALKIPLTKYEMSKSKDVLNVKTKYSSELKVNFSTENVLNIPSKEM